MKLAVLLGSYVLLMAAASSLSASVTLDYQAYGQSLGGWEGKKAKVAEYEMAANRYRSYRPDVSPTPDGGLFISVRIDHVRGFFSSDDYASLELTIDGQGRLVSTKSSISIQGKRVTSDLIAGGIRGAGHASASVSPAESVLALGTDLVANLTEKISRETKVEPGRVTFPAVVRHNLNLLYRAIHLVPAPAPPAPDPSQTDEGPPAEEPLATSAEE